jgi:hypothetical protein
LLRMRFKQYRRRHRKSRMGLTAIGPGQPEQTLRPLIAWGRRTNKTENNISGGDTRTGSTYGENQSGDLVFLEALVQGLCRSFA